MHLFTNGFIYSLTQYLNTFMNIFIPKYQLLEGLLCARHYPRPWKFSCEH